MRRITQNQEHSRDAEPLTKRVRMRRLVARRTPTFSVYTITCKVGVTYTAVWCPLDPDEWDPMICFARRSGLTIVVVCLKIAVMSPESKSGPPDQPDLDELGARLEMLQSKLYAAKIAYLNRTSFEGHEVTYDDLNTIAKEYIQTSYAIQKAKFGAVKLRLSVARLLR
jgi:hypothetical protein